MLNHFDIYTAVRRLDSESFGVAVREVSACGLPVVISNAGGLPEVVIEGKTGLVVERESGSDRLCHGKAGTHEPDGLDTFPCERV